MIAVLDVDYRGRSAVAACVAADGWDAAEPAEEHTARIERVADYVPGRFFERELPCLLAVLARLARTPDAILVDAYVRIDHGRPGLGARLYQALGGTTPVVGVAKTRFRGAAAIEVRRGGSRRPLFVTAIGTDEEAAAAHVATMHGERRVPTLIARADRLARTTA